MAQLEDNVRDDDDQKKKDKRSYYRSIFEKYDLDKTGYIELEELYHMLKADDDVPKKIVRRVFRQSDRDANGRIDFGEFMDMVQDNSYKRLFRAYLITYLQHVLPRGKTKKIDYMDECSCWPPPVMMVLIAVLEVALFCTDASADRDSTTGKGYISKWLIYDPHKRHQVWRYFTYMFVHIGYVHLVGNVCLQLCLGVLLELAHKWRVVLVYFAGVVAGSLGNSLVDPTVYLAGASGGVYALLTAHIGTIIMNWNEMPCPGLQFVIYGFYTCFDIGISIYNRFYLKEVDDVGYIAHLAGAITGLLMGIWLLKNVSLTKKETYYWWFAFVVYILWMGTMVVLNIILKNYFLENKR